VTLSASYNHKGKDAAVAKLTKDNKSITSRVHDMSFDSGTQVGGELHEYTRTRDSHSPHICC